MKVIINKCFGGFGISAEVLYELIKMKSKCITKQKIKNYYGGDKFNWEKSYSDAQVKYIKKYKNGYSVHKYHSNLYKGDYVYFLKNDYDNRISLRTHLDLIKVVKKLGKKANGEHAKLKIVEIPDGIKWEIDEYDGIETINECHRNWS